MTGPHKSETPGGAGVVANESAKQASILARAHAYGKQVATLMAQLGIAGYAVHDLSRGGFLVAETRCAGLARECADLDALRAFAQQVGAIR